MNEIEKDKIFSLGHVAFNSGLSEIPGTVWTLKKTKGEGPTPRRGHAGIVHNKALLVYGGKTQNPQEDTNFIYQLSFGNEICVWDNALNYTPNRQLDLEKSDNYRKAADLEGFFHVWTYQPE